MLYFGKEAVEIERKTSKHPITPGDVLPAIELLGDMLLELGRNEESLSRTFQHQDAKYNSVYKRTRGGTHTS